MSTKVESGTRSLESLWGLVILKLDEPEKYTSEECLIEIPEPAREMKLQGTVMHAGPGRIDIYGITHPSELKPGDRVVFGRHLGINVDIDGDIFYQIPEKYIYARYTRPEEQGEAELIWEAPVPGKIYEFLYVEHFNWTVDFATQHLFPKEYQDQDWQIAACRLTGEVCEWGAFERIVWLRRDVYKNAPKIQEIQASFEELRDLEPKDIEQALESICCVPNSKETQDLIKSMADWAADVGDQEWKDELDKEIETVIHSGPGWTGSSLLPEMSKALAPAGEEYLNTTIRADYSEPDAHEWTEIKRLQKDGWKPKEFDDNGMILHITQFSRPARKKS